MQGLGFGAGDGDLKRPELVCGGPVGGDDVVAVEDVLVNAVESGVLGIVYDGAALGFRWTCEGQWISSA